MANNLDYGSQHVVQRTSYDHGGSGPVAGLVYYVAGGTFNMYYAHLGAFLIATALNITTVHPPPHVNIRPNHMQAPFKRQPAASLFNLGYTKTYFAHNFGIEVVDTGWPHQKQCIAPFKPPRCTSFADLPAVWARYLLWLPPGCKYIKINPDVFRQLNYSTFPHLKAVIKGLPFSQRLVHLATRAKATLASHVPSGAYTGIHLRVERDGVTWLRSRGLGGEFCRSINWVLYHQAAYLAGLDNTTTLYIASAHSLAQINDEVLGRAFLHRFSGAVYAKSNLTASLTPDPVDPLASGSGNATSDAAPAPRLLGVDLLAVVDFLVVAEAEVAIGHPFSTFSWFLRGYRGLMLDLPPESFHMIDKQGMLYDVTAYSERGKHDREDAQCISLLPA